MNYLINYYKNLSEQLQEKVNYLQSLIEDGSQDDRGGNVGEFIKGFRDAGGNVIILNPSDSASDQKTMSDWERRHKKNTDTKEVTVGHTLPTRGLDLKLNKGLNYTEPQLRKLLALAAAAATPEDKPNIVWGRADTPYVVGNVYDGWDTAVERPGLLFSPDLTKPWEDSNITDTQLGRMAVQGNDVEGPFREKDYESWGSALRDTETKKMAKERIDNEISTSAPSGAVPDITQDEINSKIDDMIRTIENSESEKVKARQKAALNVWNNIVKR